MMPRDGSLLDSYKSDRCCFSSVGETIYHPGQLFGNKVTMNKLFFEIYFFASSFDIIFLCFYNCINMFRLRLSI